MRKISLAFFFFFFISIFVSSNAYAQTYTTKYLGTTAISGLGGTYWNLTDTTGAANTATSVKNAKNTGKFYFKPGTGSSTSTGNPDSGIPVGYGWGTNYTLVGTIPAGTWTFQVKTTSSSATGTGYMGVVVYKNCSGVSTRLFGVFNNTFNVLSSTSPLITVITTNQPSFDVDGCYLKAEYWLNVTTAGTSATGTVTFTVNEASEFVQFPTPSKVNYYDIQVNNSSPRPNDYVNFTVNFTVFSVNNVNLSYYIFESNITGSMSNVTFAFPSGVKSYIASYTSTSSVPVVVWRFLANDTQGNWGATPYQTIYFANKYLLVDWTVGSQINSTCSVESPCSFYQYNTFNVSVNVTCITDPPGSSCGNITGGIMYNDTVTTYKWINTTYAVPFYTLNWTTKVATEEKYNFSGITSPSLTSNATKYNSGSFSGVGDKYDTTGTEFTTDEYSYVSAYDNTRVSLSASSLPATPKFKFHFKTNASSTSIINISVYAEGYLSTDPSYLYVYDNSVSNWVQIASGSSTNNDNAFSWSTTSASSYVDADGYIHFALTTQASVGCSRACTLYADGINITVYYYAPLPILADNPYNFTLLDGQSYILNYTINVTDSPTKDYRLIFNFTSSLAPNPAENDTQPVYIRIISAEDTTPPTYSLNSTNSTLAGTAVSHNLYWQDNVGLSGYSFAFDNCTGDFTPNDPMTYNSGFENVSYYGDAYSDAEGYRPYPWGFETWAGNPTNWTRVTVDKHSGNYSVNMTGYSTNDVVVLAIPEYALKPNITVGQMYRLEAWIKLVNVQGNGVRLIQQWFNSTNIYYPEYVTYGNWYKGNSSWIKISLDSITTDPDNVKGDPVVELWGSGTVFVDDVKFYKVSGNKYIKEFTPTSSVYSGGGDYTSNIQYWDGSVVWMGANSWINVTSWGNSIPSNVFITDVIGYCGVNVSYGGILTFWTNYTGDIPFCKYDTNGAINQNFTCDLLAAGIDTPEKLNNLQMACKFDSAGNANLDWVHITAKYSYDWDAEKWVPFNGNPTSAWSNVTKVINSTVGCTIRWKVYANDTSNNWNVSEIFSYITTSPVYISISLSPTLAGGITFGNLDPNSINVSSINCNNKQCNITVSSDTTVNVDIVVKINSYLTRQGGTEIISTQYWNSSLTEQPISPAYQFSTSYDYNHKVANNVPPNTNVIFNSWLTILGGQAPGVYNNTIYFCACEAGTTNC
jgi:hypothetical protein